MTRGDPASYDAANELTNWNGAAISYDANGNLISSSVHTYAWDARNQLASIDSGGTAAFAYDPFGRRTSKTITGVSATGFLYDGSNPVQELSGSTPTASLLAGGIDEYFTRTDSLGTLNFLTDALGSTLMLLDASGNAQAQYAYDPFGGTTQSGTSTSNSFAYTGREFDTAGLYYYRARYYNPATGRFLSEDPIGFMGGINKYAYVDDDPLNFVDRFGLATTVIIWNPVGYGESSQGHASIVINGTSYSFGPNGMDIENSDYYINTRNYFRDGLGENLDLTPDQEQKLASYLRNYNQRYNLIVGRNCTTPIRDGLRSVGVNLPTPLTWDNLPPEPYQWYPSDLEWALENTSGLVSGWTSYPAHP